MNSSTTLVDRVRPLLAERSLGQTLYVAALLESGSAVRYRDWAAQASEERVARGLAECAEREDAIAGVIRRHFAGVLEQPPDLATLGAAIQREVTSLFGGRSRAEQFAVQAEAERGGQQFWKELAASEGDGATRAVLLECATLEAASAAFLESLSGSAPRNK